MRFAARGQIYNNKEKKNKVFCLAPLTTMLSLCMRARARWKQMNIEMGETHEIRLSALATMTYLLFFMALVI